MKRNHWMKQSRQENLIYLAVWGLLFAAPLLSLYVRTVSDTDVHFSWSEVFIVWRHFAVYLLLFLVHNFLLAPLLVHGHKRIVYFSIVAALLAAFTVYQCSSRPNMEGHKPPMERAKHHLQKDEPPMHEPPMDEPPFDDPPFDAPPKHERPTAFDGERPPRPEHAPPLPDKRPPHDIHKTATPPPIIGERDILAVVVLILMFGANLGIKGYFRSLEDRKRLAQLKRENLEQQLEYLRYQINPHFFMNTLNNIHALVDIDPEKAKDTILELSKMMRYVLYEGNKQGVSLAREFDFIRHYIALMQLRYTDRVKITLELPQAIPDCQIPPLVLITFIENAFKHGISYQRESFIHIQAATDDRQLLFTCRNSKAGTPNPEKGGVGLQNVRQRLNLLYDNNYTLTIQDDADVYSVRLTIPI